jgi:hypothetical protein
MAITLKYFLMGESGGLNKKTGKMDLNGIFDVITSPAFPMGIPNAVILVGMEGLTRNSVFEMRINGPDNQLIGKFDFAVAAMPEGLLSKQVINLEKIPVMARGKYTADILEKTKSGFKFVAAADLFTAVYPPKRKFREGEVEKILADKETLITQVKTEYRLPGTNEIYKFQLNLDEKDPIVEGYNPFPEDNKFVIDGKEYDLEGIRRNIEWMFGRPKVQAEKKEEEKKEEVEA